MRLRPTHKGFLQHSWNSIHKVKGYVTLSSRRVSLKRDKIINMIPIVFFIHSIRSDINGICLSYELHRIYCIRCDFFFFFFFTKLILILNWERQTCSTVVLENTQKHKPIVWENVKRCPFILESIACTTWRFDAFSIVLEWLCS